MPQANSDNLAFSRNHLWALADIAEHKATVGITEYLAENLGRIESVDMPLVDDEVEMGTFCVHLQLARGMRRLRSPLSGRVVEVNDEVVDNPGLLSLNPMDNWLYKMEFDDEDELELLMDAARYAKFVDGL